MISYVLGLDGGGTKTQCVLFDCNGKIVDFLNWGPTNHEVMKNGFKGIHKELGSILTEIFQKNSINAEDLSMCVFGMAGIDTREQHRIMSGIISGLGISKFILCNDSYLGIKAGNSTGRGICVINGTGCSVTGIDAQGRMCQIGGQGSLTGDAAGGSILGRKVLFSVYDYLFRGGRYSRMSDYMIAELDIKTKNDYLEILTRRINEGSLKIEELNKLLFTAANEKDEVAVEILASVGSELGKSVNAVISELIFEGENPLNVTLAGTINVKGSNPTLINAIKAEVFSKNPGRSIEFTLLRKPPVAGAVIWALSKAQDCSFDFKEVLTQFQ